MTAIEMRKKILRDANVSKILKWIEENAYYNDKTDEFSVTYFENISEVQLEKLESLGYSITTDLAGSWGNTKTCYTIIF